MTSIDSDTPDGASVSSKPTIMFKKKKIPSLRRRNVDECDDEDDVVDLKDKMDKLKEAQSLRKRPEGVNVIGLTLGKKINSDEETALKDPFKINNGGLLNMNALKSGKIKAVDDAYDTGIGTQFSAETNKRDEDEDMMKYIEEELSKRNVRDVQVKFDDKQATSKFFTPEEAALLSVPSYLRESSTQRSEEMLSNQMLSGIPEVDLGIDAKIRNIEATEEAKMKLLREKRNNKDGPSQFVPTNMAVNFVQHNRFNIDDSQLPRKKIDPVDVKKPDDADKKRKTEKATDDYHYEKFRKQFKRVAFLRGVLQAVVEHLANDPMVNLAKAPGQGDAGKKVCFNWLHYCVDINDVLNNCCPF